MKKIFSGVAFLLFVLALIWLFTYESGNRDLATYRSNRNPQVEPQQQNSRIVRQEQPQVVQTSATYTPPPPAQPEQQQRPTKTYSGAYIGKLGAKSYLRQGQSGNYIGAFDDYGSPVGFAVMEYKNGNKFIGEYKNGERSGRGFSIFKSTGKIKERYYANGNQQSDKNRGDLKFKSKTYAREGQSGTYTGPFKSNVPHGVGAYRYSNGDVFVGEYSNGIRHGRGTFCKNNGSCYEQVWRNGDLVN